MKKLPKHLKPLLEHKETEIDWSKEKIVSYSQYSTWKQCPHKWKLQSVDKHKNPPSIELTFGKAMHTALQHYLKVMYEQSGAAADREDIMGLFENTFREEYKIGFEQNNKTHFSSAAEMAEYFEDGREIVEFFTKHRSKYFSSRKTHLIGIEFPLACTPHENYPNVKFRGFIDFILYNEATDTICIYDIKTSKRGWRDEDKQNETKTSQILLYKEYFSKLFNWDINKVEVEFFIVKRKIWENSEYPIPRIQTFVPVSGPRKRSATLEGFRKFIEDCFDKDGKPLIKEHLKQVGPLCKWCQFNNKPELCNKQ
jgi:glutaredoxin